MPESMPNAPPREAEIAIEHEASKVRFFTVAPSPMQPKKPKDL